MIRLRLPYPVSANRYWRTYQPKGLAAPVVTLSDEAKQFKREVAWLAKKAGVVRPFNCRVEFRYWLVPHCPQDAAKRRAADPESWDLTVQCLDLDNAQKVLIDSLNGVAFEDDRLVHRIVAERAEPGTKGVIVEVAPWTPTWAQPQMALA